MSTRLPIPEGCLNATCIRCGNGKYGGLADIYQSSEHGSGGTRVHAMDIDGARRRSHEPTVERAELGLGWPQSLHIAGLEQRSVPRHSTTLNGVRRGSPGGCSWAGSIARTHGRTGPGDDPRFTSAVGSWSRNRGPQTTVTELFRNITFSPL